MSYVTKTMATSGALLGIVLIFSAACVPKDGAVGRKPAGEAGSILADLDGLNEADKKTLSDLEYWLQCESSVRVKGEPRGSGAEAKLRFVAAGIADGDRCALEIWGVKGKYDAKAYDWFGTKAGNVVEGLKYASERATVTGKSLSLKLFVLYQPRDPKGGNFPLHLAVEFEAEALPEKLSPQAVNIECGERFPGTMQAGEGPKRARLSFSLPVAKLLGKSCSLVQVKVDDKNTYNGELKALKLDKITRDQLLEFPEDKNSFVKLKLDVPAAAPIPCRNKKPDDASVCLDNKQFSLARTPQQFYLLVQVDGIVEGGSDKSYWLAYGDQTTTGNGRGLGLMSKPGEDALVFPLKTAVDAASDPEKSAYRWFEHDGSSPYALHFDNDMLAGNKLTPAKAEDLKRFTPLHFAKAMAHGFYQLSDVPMLNEAALKSEVQWMVVLEAKSKDGQSSEKFLVSEFSNDKHLVSAAPYFVKNDSRELFNVREFHALSNLVQEDSKRKLAIYALESNSLKPATGCNLQLKAWINSMSAREYYALTTNQAELLACEIDKATFDGKYGPATEATLNAAEVWRWGWFDL